MNEGAAPHERLLPGAEARELAFGLPDLPEVRDHAAGYATRNGMPDALVGDFLVAVNEVTTNAVTHGDGKAQIRLFAMSDRIVVEVHDEGHWHPAGPPGRTPPAAHATSGMGLWVARRLATSITFTTGPRGTTVTMGFEV
ncbi:ATP-binding protein [Streptosporangium soli]|nr:ATP-binding protein [Streptosporangium sp. KLBMP 9127]